jgi:hypothetical protein
MAHLDAEHVGKLLGRLELCEMCEIRSQRDWIAAFVAGREVSPPTGAKIDPEGAQAAVIPGGI